MNPSAAGRFSSQQGWISLDGTMKPPSSAEAGRSSMLTRLQTAFISDRVDVAAVNREMLTVTNFFGGLEAQVQALVKFRQDRTQD